MSDTRSIVRAVSAHTTGLVQLRRHVTRLLGCDACPDMIRPVVSGNPVLSPVMLIGQAPGVREGPAGKPFAWTAGKTMFGWFGDKALGLEMPEDEFRARVYMAAVCRCFPGKATGGGDRVPSDDEVERCSKHLAREVAILRPRAARDISRPHARHDRAPASIGRVDLASHRAGQDVIDSRAVTDRAAPGVAGDQGAARVEYQALRVARDRAVVRSRSINDRRC
jgi:uracil-DNA glycosylase family 4